MPSSSSAAAADPLPPPSKLELEPQVGGLEAAADHDDASLSKMSTSAAAAGDSLASSSSLMDFSQLFNFLPLNGPPYNQVAGGGGGGAQGGAYPAAEEPAPLVQLPQPAPDGPDGAAENPLQGLNPAFISNLSSATTLPRFHQAFQ